MADEFAVIEAFRDREQGRIVDAIGKTAALTGPHFRFEEEAFYPSLVELVGKDNLSADDSRRAVDLVRAIPPHVSTATVCRSEWRRCRKCGSDPSREFRENLSWSLHRTATPAPEHEVVTAG